MCFPERMRQINNALLLPYRPPDHPDFGLMLVQDRRGHKPPPWGFFGGGIEYGETSLEAVLRETWEELGLRLSEPDLQFGTEISGQLRDFQFGLHLYTWPCGGDLSEVVLGEGAGIEWLTPEQMLDRVEVGGPDEAICGWVRRFLNALD
jgi:8-oxo-dGTP pyrophosphatase MutT (NUDIX family)